MTNIKTQLTALAQIIARHVTNAAREQGRTNFPKSLADTSLRLTQRLATEFPCILQDPESYNAKIGTAVRNAMPNC